MSHSQPGPALLHSSGATIGPGSGTGIPEAVAHADPDVAFNVPREGPSMAWLGAGVVVSTKLGPGDAFDAGSAMLTLMPILLEAGVATTMVLGEAVDGTDRLERAVSRFAGGMSRLWLEGTTTRIAAAENW